MIRKLTVVATLLLITIGHCVFGQAPDEKVKAYWEAARSGDIAGVKQAIRDQLDLDAVTEFNCGAIYFAANQNRAEVIKLLAQAGADVNLRDTDYGFTPVQMAAWLGHTEATDALIDAGATKGDVVGSCFAAASNGHAETVRRIVEKLEIKGGQLTALWNTAKNTGHTNVCKVLEELGAEPPKTKSSDDGQTTSEESESAAETQTESEPDQQPKFDFESDQALPVTQAVNWPAFRGTGRTGVADGQHPPAAFDLETQRNIKWQVPVEGLGLSSPIVWDGRIFITTAVSSATQQTIDDNGLGWISSVPEDVPHQWKILCYDLETGSKIWERVACEGKPRSQRHWKASQANPTCVTDGKHLVASFGSQGLYCYDLDGNLKWKNDLGELDNGWYIDSTFPWGFASSPILFGSQVILQCDIYDTPFIAAYDLADGKPLWRTERENELSSWGTPLIVEGQRNELVTNASKAIRSYDPEDGRLLWQINGNSPITVASPVAGDGLIVATGGYKDPKPIYVVRHAVGNGDITPEENGSSPSVAWSSQVGGVYIVTPIFYQGLLYMCKQNGVLTVYDPATGDKKYGQRLKTGAITASPVAADGKLYFVGEGGKVVVIRAGDSFEQISISELGESTLATPAISNGTIVYRTVKGLVAVAHKVASP